MLLRPPQAPGFSGNGQKVRTMRTKSSCRGIFLRSFELLLLLRPFKGWGSPRISCGIWWLR